MPPSIEHIREYLKHWQVKKNSTFYELGVGRYLIRVWTPTSKSHNFRDEALKHDRISIHPTVDVHLIELHKHPNQDSLPYDGTIEVHLDLREVEPFKSNQDLWYKTFRSPNGLINLGNGDDMPVTQLCELIRFLHRLSNLSAFM